MLEMETPGKVAVLPINKSYHDTKRFRLRAVSHEAEIYQRYFNTSLARMLSLVQIALGSLILIAQLTLSTTLQMRNRISATSPFETVTWGTWFSFVTLSTAALMSIWASRKPSYSKLHTAMALNITGVCILFGVLYALKYIQVHDYWGSKSKSYSDLITSLHYWGSTTTASSDEDPMIAVCILGSTVLSSFIILQIFLSVFMACHTARAICCGRTQLEGKFLEMEAVTKDKESADAIVNFRLGRRESSISNSSSPNHSPPPPPYVPPQQLPELQEIKGN